MAGSSNSVFAEASPTCSHVELEACFLLRRAGDRRLLLRKHAKFFVSVRGGIAEPRAGRVGVTAKQYGGFPKLAVPFGGPYNKDYTSIGSFLGSPYFGKPPYWPCHDFYQEG